MLKLEKTTTWLANFKRWSTLIHALMAGVSIYQWLPDAIATAQSSMQLYEPVLSPGWYAGLMMLLGIAGVVARNLKQPGVA